MKPIYDVVFVTHLPAFYKVNLYREIAKHCRVFVIYIASGSAIRTSDFVATTDSFDYCVLNDGAFETRSIMSSLWRLFKIMRSIRARLVVLGGWDLAEFWALACFSNKKNNALALESTIYDSQYRGLKSMIKRRFLTRMSVVFASGSPHRALLKSLHYKGRILTTLGVGIFHYDQKIIKQPHPFSGKFLFVGRLSSEKNIKRLVDVFRQLSQFSLTIVGQGPLAETLQSQCPPNVHLLGHVPNAKLGACYSEHDILILPSLKEPWGLVVEEALYYGLPVIASQRVGCALDWIEHYQVGKVFDPLNNHAIEEAILWSASHYPLLVDQLKRVNFSLRDCAQVRKYLEALP